MTWLFAFTVLLSSSLLFFAEPLCAKMLLPTLGGSPAVWNGCMVFFQAGLLLGYCYAHFGTSLLGQYRHAFVHVGLLAVGLLSLPLLIPRVVAPPSTPALWLIRTLLGAIGLPF